MGTPVEKVLNDVKLPVQLLDDSNMLLPEIPSWKFVYVVNRRKAFVTLGHKQQTWCLSVIYLLLTWFFFWGGGLHIVVINKG